MSATHIVFVAWEGAVEKEGQADLWAKKGNTERSTSSKGEKRKFKAVIYHPQRQSENLKKIQVGQIYILGHGASGFGSIGDVDGDVNDDNVRLLSGSQVADRLIASGLKKHFMGDIKCFSCDSAKRTNGLNSFADVFADAMFEREYTHCRIFGYTMALNAGYTDQGYPNDKGVLLHKHAMEANGSFTGTAKNYRVERTNFDAAHERARRG